MKKYTSSPTAQMLLEAGKDAVILHIEDLRDAFPGLSHQTLKGALSRLVKNGDLYRVRRGLYLHCEYPYKPDIGDPKALALRLYKGYIGFSTALAHWGLVEYEPFTIFVVTENKTGTTSVGEFEIRAVSMGRRARGMVFDSGVYVSTLEKTLFDCIYKPSHGSGYRNIARAISESEPDWDVLYGWFESCASQALRQRAAYVLSKAGNAPKWLPGKLTRGASQKVWLDPSGPRNGKYVGEWKVMDNVGRWN